MSLTAALRDSEQAQHLRAGGGTPQLHQGGGGSAHDAVGRQQAHEGARGCARLQPVEPLDPWHRAHRCGRGAVSELPPDAGDARRLCGRRRAICRPGPMARCACRRRATMRDCVLAPLVLEFVGRYPTCAFSLCPRPIVSRPSTMASTSSSPAAKPSVPGLVDCDLGVVGHVVCASPPISSARAGRRSRKIFASTIVWSILSAHPRIGRFNRRSKSLLVQVKGTLSSNSADVLIQMALQGHGIVRVPRYAVRAELASKSLRSVV